MMSVVWMSPGHLWILSAQSGSWCFHSHCVQEDMLGWVVVVEQRPEGFIQIDSEEQSWVCWLLSPM